MSSKKSYSHKGTKSVVQSASKGNLLSMHQLYQTFSTGDFSEEKDEAEAQKYLQALTDGLASSHFQITELTLRNFRRIKELSIELDPKLTVIIGDNGAGKTSVAEALTRVLELYGRNIKKEDDNSTQLSEWDISVNATDYTEVHASAYLNKHTPINTSLSKAKKGFTGTAHSDRKASKAVGSSYRIAEKERELSFPFFAYYPVDRSGTSLEKTVKENSPTHRASSRFDPYDQIVRTNRSLDKFVGEYIRLVNIETGQTSPEILQKQTLIDGLKQASDLGEGNGSLTSIIQKHERELAELLDANPAPKVSVSSFVDKAIESLVPDVSSLRIDRSSGDAKLMVMNFKNQVNVTQLSQGQKTLMALAGDMAIQMIKLNPYSKNPLAEPGIVIIDEVELHLHPRWQQRVLNDFASTFPKLQFVVTTHSPQVLSTIEPEKIRILRAYNDEIIYEVPVFQTEGSSSADVLAQIMLVDPEPVTKAKELIQIFYRNIAEKKVDSATKSLEEIEGHFGVEHSIFLKAKSRLDLLLMKEKFLKGNE